MDTQRADRLSCYGYRKPTTPHIDALARDGVRFASFISPHIPTFPGHTTMFTGKDLYAHGITGQSHQTELDPSVKTLAEILSRNGYYTAAADTLGRWFARGFDQAKGYGWSPDPDGSLRKGEGVNKTAIPMLEECARQPKPFFLFVHYWDPHSPYLPPAPYKRMFYGGDETDPANASMEPVLNFPPFMWYFREWMGHVTDIEYVKAQYDGETAYGDACLGQLFTRLDELKLADDTLVVLTADHGEELDEHRMWFDHHGLYDTNLHVPLLMRWPAGLPKGATVNGLTCMLDLAPTILDLAGLADEAEKERMEGASMVPLLRDPSPIPRGTCDWVHVTENTWMKKRGIRTHEWKFIRSLEPDIHGMPMQELYRLTDDPGERRNLADERPDVVARFSAQLEERVAKRLEATGRVGADPLLLQPIPMRRIGSAREAHPEDENLAK
jgi:arylsulfatase A-like enzyme